LGEPILYPFSEIELVCDFDLDTPVAPPWDSVEAIVFALEQEFGKAQRGENSCGRLAE